MIRDGSKKSTFTSLSDGAMMKEQSLNPLDQLKAIRAKVESGNYLVQE